MRIKPYYLVLVCLFLLTNVALTQANPGRQPWPKGWSDTEALFTSGIFGERFFAINDKEQTNLVTLDGTNQRNLALNYSVLADDQVIVEQELARGEIKTPEFVIDSQSIRHLLFVERDGRINRLVHLRFDSTGEIISSDVLLTGEYVLQDPKLEISGGQLHVTWVSGEGPVYTVYYGVIEEASLNLVQPVAVTEGTSIRPAIIGDQQGQVHIAWLEVDVRGPALMYAQRSFGSFSRPHKLAELTPRVVNQGGRINLFKQGNNIGIIFDDGPQVNLPDGYYLHFMEIASSGKVVSRPRIISPGQRPKLLSVAGETHIVWQQSLAGTPQVHYGILESGEITQSLLLNARRGASFRPELVVDSAGNVTVFWLTAAESGYYIQAINNREPQDPPFWWYLGIDAQNPWLHLLFLISGATMLSLSYVGMNLLVAVIGYGLMLAILSLAPYRKTPIFYHIWLAAGILMILQQTPIAFGKPEYFGSLHYALTVLLATASCMILLRRVNLERGFAYAVIIGLWLFWQQLYALIPVTLAAL